MTRLFCLSACVQLSLTGQDLFDMIASQFALHEKTYFGINWVDKEYVHGLMQESPHAGM